MEVVFVPEGSLVKLDLERVVTSPALLSPEVKDDFKRKRAKREPFDPNEDLPISSLSLNLAGGGEIMIVGISEATLFDINEGLRATLTSKLDLLTAADRKVRLNLKELSNGLAEQVMFSVSALLVLSGWKAVRFGVKAKKGKDSKDSKAVRDKEIEVVSKLDVKLTKDITTRALALAAANCRVRSYAELPPNELNPKSYRGYAENFAKSRGLKTEFLDVTALQKLNAGAFLSVARADLTRGAGILKVSYRPTGLKSGAKAKTGGAGPIALVGKGICFDTGGYNIKSGQYMLGMHGDMTGSAIVLHLIAALKDLNFKEPVDAYLAISENLISANAYKPNEVVTAMDGTSIEVVDTDAEGRMILADTLALVRRTKPKFVMDFATLTGAAIRSVGTRRSCVFSHDAKWLDIALSAGNKSGERVWGFPLSSDYRRVLKSEVADLVQCSPSNNSDHIYAATLLGHFIGRETPWLHVDLSASENKGGLGLVGSNTTGFGIFFAYEFLTSLKD